MLLILRTVFTVTLFLLAFIVKGQESYSIPRKKINITKISEAPKIDGVLDDLAWQNAAIATDFVERQPNNGKPIPDSLRTEVKIVYDDRGIYFGATMFDPE